VGLKIDEEKTKYMKMSAVGDSRWTTNVTIEECRFERVKRISYTGNVLNSENFIKEEISARIMSDNRAYFTHVKLLNWNLLSRNSKVKPTGPLLDPL
jgi:hypothetical protein